MICFLKTAIREAELLKVPTVKENGTTDEGKIKFNKGIKIKLAPPPQIALIQNATTVPKKSKNKKPLRVFFICNHPVYWTRD